MTTLTFTQVQKLLTMVSMSVPDQLECDGCFDLIAEFADAEIRGAELSQSLIAVRIHFSQCPCCAYEYAALLEALKEPEAMK
jgi:hypothetical protein